MGAKVPNIGGGRDFTTNEYYIEFHRRVVISEKDWKQVTTLLDSRNVDEARNILKKVAPRNAHSVIDLFLGELSEKGKKK